ncbi:MAG: glycosyltransferase family 4 protein [Arcobacter sp.]|nr:glycosyltransferase family 4 protein [Arcobacter sp.]
MKFLYFSFVLPHLLKDDNAAVGGAAVQWKSWIKGFRGNGHEFGVLTWKGAEKYIDKNLDFDIVECYKLEKEKKKWQLLYYQIPKLYVAIKKYNPDYLIQASATYQTVILMVIAKLLRIPFIHRVAHDTHVDGRISTMVEKKGIFAYKIGLRYSDYIFAQNSYQFNELRKKYPKKNIFILHNPFEVTTKEAELLPQSSRHYVAWIGNFRHMKNLPALVKIATQMPKIKFKIAGMELNIDKETKVAIEKLKEMKNVEFVGYLTRTEIKPFLLQSIALLNTSLYEGFSNTFLEAWSCGTPVVSTTNVNPDQLISKFNLGQIAKNHNQLSQALKIITDYDEYKYQKLVLRCYRYVLKHHSPKILASKFSLLLKNKDESI